MATTTTTASWCAKQTEQTPLTYWNVDTQTDTVLFFGFLILNNILGFVFGRLTKQNKIAKRVAPCSRHGKQNSYFFFNVINRRKRFIFLMKMQRHGGKRAIFIGCWTTTMAQRPLVFLHLASPLPSRQLETLSSETDDIRSPPLPDAVKIFSFLLFLFPPCCS